MKCMAQGIFHIQALLIEIIHFCAEEIKMPTAHIFRFMHRDIGMVHQGVHFHTIFRIQTDAYTGRRNNIHVGNLAGLRQQTEHFLYSYCSLLHGA
ncbi:Uncharacterised protein [Yersinia enterocolitica]|nr:Uncharacterised protein [Yersinia enterocolitica]